MYKIFSFFHFFPLTKIYKFRIFQTFSFGQLEWGWQLAICLSTWIDDFYPAFQPVLEFSSCIGLSRIWQLMSHLTVIWFGFCQLSSPSSGFCVRFSFDCFDTLDIGFLSSDFEQEINILRQGFSIFLACSTLFPESM